MKDIFHPSYVIHTYLHYLISNIVSVTKLLQSLFTAMIRSFLFLINRLQLILQFKYPIFIISFKFLTSFLSLIPELTSSSSYSFFNYSSSDTYGFYSTTGGSYTGAICSYNYGLKETSFQMTTSSFFSITTSPPIEESINEEPLDYSFTNSCTCTSYYYIYYCGSCTSFISSFDSVTMMSHHTFQPNL